PSTVFLSTYRNTPSSRLLFATSLYDHRYLHSFPTRRSSDLDSSEISESVNFCVMEAIKLCRLDTPIIFIEARINLIGVSNLQSFIASMTDRKSGSAGMPRPISYAVFCLKKKRKLTIRNSCDSR